MFRLLEEVRFNKTTITGAGLEPFSQKQIGLKVISAVSTQIAQNGMPHIATFKTLEELYLDSNKITDAHFRLLTGMVNMRILSIGRNGISDQVMRVIRQMKNLVELNLGGCGLVSDAGIKAIRGLKQIQYLNIDKDEL